MKLDAFDVIVLVIAGVSTLVIALSALWTWLNAPDPDEYRM